MLHSRYYHSTIEISLYYARDTKVEALRQVAVRPSVCLSRALAQKWCVLSPVHTSNNVEATLSNATSWTILSTMSNVASTLLPFLATMLPVLATMSNEISSVRHSRNRLNIFNLFRRCRKDKMSFDIVAVFGNEVECCFNKVECCFDIVVSVDMALRLIGLTYYKTRIKTRCWKSNRRQAWRYGHQKWSTCTW